MYLVYYNKEKAEELVEVINHKEGVPKSYGNTNTMASVISHTTQEKYAIQVNHLTHRGYISELFAQERIQELAEDLYEENWE